MNWKIIPGRLVEWALLGLVGLVWLIPCAPHRFAARCFRDRAMFRRITLEHGLLWRTPIFKSRPKA